jgi:hypothetical protein
MAKGYGRHCGISLRSDCRFAAGAGCLFTRYRMIGSFMQRMLVCEEFNFRNALRATEQAGE